MNLPPLNLPPFQIKVRHTGAGLSVFDPLRRRYVALTPEEYVRQHFVNWMITDLHYPASIMANEMGVEFNGMKRRCDTVVWRPDRSPLIIAEYKAPTVKITQKTFDQIVSYNSVLRARYLIVSNGMEHFCCRMDYCSGNYEFMPTVPDYREADQNNEEQCQIQ